MKKYGPEHPSFSSTTPPQELNRAIRSGDPDAWNALEVLSLMAMSGNSEVQRLVNQIDQDVRLGIIKMPPFPETTTYEDDTDLSFFLFHPLLAIKTKIKQVKDKEFPTLPLYEAYVAMVREGQLPPPSIDWHRNDPLGINKPPKLGDIPEHHNE
ncbi:hypothetical protein HYU90_01990 [Candidatus Collierbacteria bacterium]|nr:hypothetical protein [Candidatus Collierbacteria bacterium]